MNTTENNKIIAEFMGYEISFGDTSQPCIMLNQGVWTPIKYHSDWNHLMLVVDKISENDFVDEFEIKKCSIFGNIVKITPSKKDTFDSFYFDSTKENLIEVVYNSCLQFIKWHKSQNTSK